MFRRTLLVFTLLATITLLGDVGQIVCFGEDGHVALERMISDEHLRMASSSVDTALGKASHALPERTHVDVSLGEAGVGRAIAQGAPAAVVAHVVRPSQYVGSLVNATPIAESQSLNALRTTVLRS